jgi:hypothetical protein
MSNKPRFGVLSWISVFTLAMALILAVLGEQDKAQTALLFALYGLVADRILP